MQANDSWKLDETGLNKAQTKYFQKTKAEKNVNIHMISFKTWEKNITCTKNFHYNATEIYAEYQRKRGNDLVFEIPII